MRIIPEFGKLYFLEVMMMLYSNRLLISNYITLFSFEPEKAHLNILTFKRFLLFCSFLFPFFV